MNFARKACVVSLHGVGFEQPPQPGIDNSGYADLLHMHLKDFLGDCLSDDPYRQRNTPGENGAIYVQSLWPNPEGKASSEAGLQRLGTWSQAKTCVDPTRAPLTSGDEAICHIALVYSNLEPQGPEIDATWRTLTMALGSTLHYSSVLGFIHMALADGWAVLQHLHDGQEAASSRPRTDIRQRPGLVASPSPSTQDGLLKTFQYLEDDLACYICYNEIRERVRSFVGEALTRLAMRDDVESIILNVHSNGGVIAFDVLRHLDSRVTQKIKALITTGCPLRKYVDLFQWGAQIQCLTAVEPWYNFWDRHDPVGDPLEPPPGWRVGDPLVKGQSGLFTRLDLATGTVFPMPVIDREVDNVEKSQGGGLQAHNYWDNGEQFVQPVATLLANITGCFSNQVWASPLV